MFLCRLLFDDIIISLFCGPRATRGLVSLAFLVSWVLREMMVLWDPQEILDLQGNVESQDKKDKMVYLDPAVGVAGQMDLLDASYCLFFKDREDVVQVHCGTLSST